MAAVDQGYPLAVPGSALQEETVQLLQTVIQKFEQDGRLGFFWKMLHSKEVTAWEACCIGGHPITNAEEGKIVLAKIERDRAYERLQYSWQQLFQHTSISALNEVSGDSLVYIRDIEEKIKEALSWQENPCHLIQQLLQENGCNENKIKEFSSSPRDLRKFLAYIKNEIFPYAEIAVIFIDMQEIQKELQSYIQALQMGDAIQSNVCRQLRKALENSDAETYKKVYTQYQVIQGKGKAYKARIQLLEKLRQTAPGWADAIQQQQAPNDRVSMPENIQKIWDMKQLQQTYDAIFSEDLETRQKKADEYSRELREQTISLASHMAWMHLKRRLDGKDAIQSALQSWMALMKKIGKGTGKRAPSLQRQARQCMKQGQVAVPAWIVTVKQALEMFVPDHNHFDIAIIDEASQASLDALAVTLLADKIIVVGDDKQLSPWSYQKDADIEAVLRKNLAGYIANWNLFDGKTSLYDIVGTTFTPLILREHFRCVPEIIGYCNEKFYDNQILPLRTANSSQLVPAVINYQVEGTRDRDTINTVEAITAASLVLACWEQPEYEGKTFGIITLLEKKQAEYIGKLIRQHCENESILKERKLMCGNAESFQGDERDVMILSMVDDAQSRRKDTTPQRRRMYNVAVSRAKDQLWLVNSLDYKTIPEDSTDEEDVKRGLLEYTINYKQHEAALDTLQKKAESPFEIEVGRQLLGKGYHIVPQYKVGPYRIDFVAFYREKKIAIECDGKAYHSSPEAICHDMERECILKRIGNWQFIRIPSGRFYRYKEQTMRAVYKKLQDYGIFPEQMETEDANEANDLKQRVIDRAAALRKAWNGGEEPAQQSVSAVEPDIRIPQEAHRIIVEKGSKKEVSVATVRGSKTGVKSVLSERARVQTVLAFSPESTSIREQDTREQSPVKKEESLIGQKVYSRKWGEGTIVHSEKKSKEMTKLTVQFFNGERHTFMSPIAFKSEILRKM